MPGGHGNETQMRKANRATRMPRTGPQELDRGIRRLVPGTQGSSGGPRNGEEATGVYRGVQGEGPNGLQRGSGPDALGGPVVARPPAALDPLCGKLPVPGRRLPRAGGKNPEVTVCQVFAATGAVVQSWSPKLEKAAKLLERTAWKIRYHQRRKARARASRTQSTTRKRRPLGIDVNTLQRADSDTSSRCSTKG